MIALCFWFFVSVSFIATLLLPFLMCYVSPFCSSVLRYRCNKTHNYLANYLLNCKRRRICVGAETLNHWVTGLQSTWINHDWVAIIGTLIAHNWFWEHNSVPIKSTLVFVCRFSSSDIYFIIICRISVKLNGPLLPALTALFFPRAEVMWPLARDLASNSQRVRRKRTREHVNWTIWEACLIGWGRYGGSEGWGGGDLIRPPGEWEYPVGEIQEQRLPSAQSGCGLIMSENRKRKVRGAAL